MELSELVNPENILKLIAIITSLVAGGIIIKKVSNKIIVKRKSNVKISNFKNKTSILGLFNKSHNGDITNNFDTRRDANDKEQD